MAIEINATTNDKEATVEVSGFLNANTAPELEAKVDELIQGCESVTFEFSKLEYISSAGLRVLMSAYKRAAGVGGTIRVVGTSAEVREVFEITGFTDLFEVA